MFIPPSPPSPPSSPSSPSLAIKVPEKSSEVPEGELSIPPIRDVSNTSAEGPETNTAQDRGKIKAHCSKLGGVLGVAIGGAVGGHLGGAVGGSLGEAAGSALGVAVCKQIEKGGGRHVQRTVAHVEKTTEKAKAGFNRLRRKR